MCRVDWVDSIGPNGSRIRAQSLSPGDGRSTTLGVRGREHSRKDTLATTMHLNRRTIRSFAAAVSASMAAIYFLIGAGVLQVVTADAAGDMSLLFFGLSAGSMFLLGAILLIAIDRRILWILGTAFQILVIWGYFAVAPDRTPAFETWGILLRTVQLPLLAALLYLAIQRPQDGRHAEATIRRGALRRTGARGRRLPVSTRPRSVLRWRAVRAARTRAGLGRRGLRILLAS